MNRRGRHIDDTHKVVSVVVSSEFGFMKTTIPFLLLLTSCRGFVQQSPVPCARRSTVKPINGLFSNMFDEKDDSWKDEVAAQNAAILQRRKTALKGEKLHNVYRKQGRK